MNPKPDDSSALNETIMSAVRSQQSKARVLIVVAVCLSIVAILAGIATAWANMAVVAPMQRLLLEDYGAAAQQSSKNAEGKPILSTDQLVWRHVQVTAAEGKAIFLTDASIALLAVGTLVILLVVNLNRRMTLRQINLALAQISSQISELQRRQPPSQ